MAGVVAFTGKAGSGKSTAADHLVARGWSRVKFADPLKDMIRALLASSGMQAAEIERRIEGDLKERPEPVLGGRTPRYAMQTIGTEWGRDIMVPDLWIGIARARILQHLQAGRDVVIDDCRFENEADLINELGGLIVEVQGRGGIAGAHQSEQGVRASVRCLNDGTIDELHGWLDYVFVMGDVLTNPH